MSRVRQQDEQQQQNDIAEFIRFTRVGQSVMGRVHHFFGKDIRAMLLEPVIVYDSVNDPGTTYGSVAVGLGSNLRSQIQDEQDEVGRWLRITFTGEQEIQTSGGRKISPRKLFKVEDLSFDEAAALGRVVTDHSNRDNPFKHVTDQSRDRGADPLPF